MSEFQYEMASGRLIALRVKVNLKGGGIVVSKFDPFWASLSILGVLTI